VHIVHGFRLRAAAPPAHRTGKQPEGRRLAALASPLFSDACVPVRAQTKDGIKGRYWMTEADLRRGAVLKLDKSGRAVLMMMRTLGRLQEVRGASVVSNEREEGGRGRKDGRGVLGHR
jgi:Spindle and kinetochore-associated protein 1